MIRSPATPDGRKFLGERGKEKKRGGGGTHGILESSNAVWSCVSEIVSDERCKDRLGELIVCIVQSYSKLMNKTKTKMVSKRGHENSI